MHIICIFYHHSPGKSKPAIEGKRKVNTIEPGCAAAWTQEVATSEPEDAGIAEQFGGWQYARCDPGIRHQLKDIIVTVIFVSTCGADSVVEVEASGRGMLDPSKSVRSCCSQHRESVRDIK